MVAVNAGASWRPSKFLHAACFKISQLPDVLYLYSLDTHWLKVF